MALILRSGGPIGYLDSLINDLGKLTEIFRKWDNVGQEDREEKEDE